MAETKTTSTKAETKFPVAVLRGNCKKLFNVTKTVFDGVFYNQTEPISKTEAKAKIDAWLKKEAK